MTLVATILKAGVVDGGDDVFTFECAAIMAALVPAGMPITDGLRGPSIGSVRMAEFARETNEVRILANPAPHLAERLRSGEYVMRPGILTLDVTYIDDGPDRKIRLVERAEITELAVIPASMAVPLERNMSQQERPEAIQQTASADEENSEARMSWWRRHGGRRIADGIEVQLPPPGPPPDDPPSEE